jgi:streptogrisin C
MRTLIRRVVTGASALALGLAVLPAGVASAGPTVSQRAADGTAAVLAAMQRDLGLSPDAAKARFAQQAQAMAADRSLQARLGQSYGGAWFDAASGRLVVGVTDAGRVGEVRSAGADVRVVKHSAAELDGIKAELDGLAGRTSSTKSGRPTTTKRSPAVAGLVAWHVDAATDTVVVSTVKGQQAAGLGTLAKYGDAVRVEQLPSAPTATAEFMDGGDLINFSSCSAGFNLRNPSTGQGYLLTAGHCVSAGSSVTGQGGVFFGTVLESFFPTFDDALIRADNPGFWIQGPWVDVNPSQGGVIVISGPSAAPAGTTLCKSGIRTLLTCGTIAARGETVTFDGVNTVFDEVRHTACVMKGDSGGSNFAVGSTYTAEGVTSGAVLYGSDLHCGAGGAEPTVSWYFPISNSLGYYGPKYGISTW